MEKLREAKLNLGKLDPKLLEKLVLKHQGAERPEVVFAGSVGRDCGILRFGEVLLALSCDPITGTAQGIGTLAPHVVANDLICAGAEPVGVLLSLLFPPLTTPQEVALVMEEIDQTCRKLGISILGGHTEITDALSRVIVHCAGVGKVLLNPPPDPTRIQPGDCILMTKGAGIEGTAILAREREEELRTAIPEELLRRAQSLIEQISVVEEGKVALRFPVHCLHDATEGGILGGVWEATEAARCGFYLEEEKVTVYPETEALARHFQIDPLTLIGSGSLLIFTDHPEPLLFALREKGITASCIGKVTAKDTRCIKRKNGKEEEIRECPQDALWKISEATRKE
ncbi:AIR synthase family protein [Thermatribacter velox]|uniref:AIR synthase family protein n=1 Tax=Thermatribacter velox TaxID=3039681 RepID=A0ABZ2Y9A7_9BACT